MAASLGPHDVHVRYRVVAPGDDEAMRAIAVLSPDERARAARFVFERDRVSYIAAHILLRQTLSACADIPAGQWDLVSTPSGKPVLAAHQAGCGLSFNLSHTEGLVACVVGRGTDVGVDVEVVASRNVSVEVAERFFSPAEVAHLRACADGVRDVRFTELWTLKEAYIKAVGTGLSHPLDTFSVLPDGPAGFRFEAPAGVDPTRWQFQWFAPSGRHRMAVAVHRATGEPCRIVVKSESGR